MKRFKHCKYKSERHSFLVLVILSAITVTVLTVLVSFAASGTLGKLTSNATAQSSAVPAAQFNFNEVYDLDNNRFLPIVWNLDNLGATINSDYSEKLLYPGSYGQFSLDVSLISDVPIIAKSTVEYINETGAFNTSVYFQNTDVLLSDLISLNFIVLVKDKGVAPTAEEINFENDSIMVRLSGLDDALENALENAIGTNGKYTALGVKIEKTVYVYWKWDYEIDVDGNELDTLFANYISKFRDDGLDSELGISVTMLVNQDIPSGQ